VSKGSFWTFAHFQRSIGAEVLVMLKKTNESADVSSKPQFEVLISRNI